MIRAAEDVVHIKPHMVFVLKNRLVDENYCRQFMDLCRAESINS